ncbi:CatB-related O-acetyltransferase [Chitinophagaceae bacterium LB-8]|uniref:CatB-related O-acetyltransferase n=2 Tax=Paraflavisolibacter caeni TaxID=2982496 RepID=A0A9X3B799_9BACT|nr:CatB-related O-acetyltransferase [Paraflavisolibacter caeni]
MYSNTIRQIYEEKHKIKIGYGSYGGCFSLKNVPAGVSFGNYCSIAPTIRIFRANHPKNKFTSHPILYNPAAGYVTKDALKRPTLTIGHDVWIGEWAIILPNVSYIGNGAIIGAGSVVTRNVDPYSIVAGNPAKVIGKRFDDSVIKKIEESKWWFSTKEELIKNIQKFQDLVEINEKNIIKEF